MTQRKDFEEVIRKRLEQLNKQKKETLSTRKVPKAVRGSEKASEVDQGVDKDEQVKRSQKAKQKRLNGYKNRSGKKRGK